MSSPTQTTHQFQYDIIPTKSVATILMAYHRNTRINSFAMDQSRPKSTTPVQARVQHKLSGYRSSTPNGNGNGKQGGIGWHILPIHIPLFISNLAPKSANDGRTSRSGYSSSNVNANNGYIYKKEKSLKDGSVLVTGVRADNVQIGKNLSGGGYHSSPYSPGSREGGNTTGVGAGAGTGAYSYHDVNKETEKPSTTTELHNHTYNHNSIDILINRQIISPQIQELIFDSVMKEQRSNNSNNHQSRTTSYHSQYHTANSDCSPDPYLYMPLSPPPEHARRRQVQLEKARNGNVDVNPSGSVVEYDDQSKEDYNANVDMNIDIFEDFGCANGKRESVL